MEKTMLDLTPREGVSVQIRSDGKVVWGDVDGLCRLRASAIPELKVFDDRPRRRRRTDKEGK
jgi:hypothetical protein